MSDRVLMWHLLAVWAITWIVIALFFAREYGKAKRAHELTMAKLVYLQAQVDRMTEELA